MSMKYEHVVGSLISWPSLMEGISFVALDVKAFEVTLYGSLGIRKDMSTPNFNILYLGCSLCNDT